MQLDCRSSTSISDVPVITYLSSLIEDDDDDAPLAMWFLLQNAWLFVLFCRSGFVYIVEKMLMILFSRMKKTV